MQHFDSTHSRDEHGRFIVPLPLKPESTALGESRPIAVRRFRSLERSLAAKGQFKEFASVMREYFTMNHAERVPVDELDKSPSDVYYLPMHAVRNEGRTTSKLRIVFDASA